MLLVADSNEGSLCSSDEVMTLIEELQYSLGEGPCLDAFDRGAVVLEPDLANPAVTRWPAFSPPAVDAGARAVFAFPISVGAIRLGALDLYQDRPGALDDGQHTRALALAELIATWVLDRQGAAAPGSLAPSLETGADFHFVVHNAAGMISAQLGIGIAEALVRLRAHAFGQDRLVSEVARDVVERRIRFE